VYFSYLTEGRKDMLRRVLKRANLMGFIFQGYDLDQLNETSQDKWFHHCWSERHCLHHLFTVKSRQHGAMHLRQHGHDFVLRNIKYDFNKRHFIAPSLFYYVQILCLCFMCMYCMNCFFIDDVVRLLFYVNVCTCHVYFTINLLTYLLLSLGLMYVKN